MIFILINSLLSFKNYYVFPYMNNHHMFFLPGGPGGPDFPSFPGIPGNPTLPGFPGLPCGP